jgi:hypothetical protein
MSNSLSFPNYGNANAISQAQALGGDTFDNGSQQQPDNGNANAITQAQALGGDTDSDGSPQQNPRSTNTSPSPPPNPPIYNNTPNSFDIPSDALIPLQNDINRLGGPAPIPGPFWTINITQTLTLMQQHQQQNPTHQFFRLKWALKNLHQGLMPTCRFPFCTSRCRIVDHNLKPLNKLSLLASTNTYNCSEKEHAVFLSSSCFHGHDWIPQFAWTRRTVAFCVDPVAAEMTYSRWMTPNDVHEKRSRSEIEAEDEQDESENVDAAGNPHNPPLSRRAKRSRKNSS